MPPQLGKRKRVTREELEQASRSPSPESDAQSQSEDDSEDEEVDVQELFRRAFEARFKPLEVEVKKRKVEKEKNKGKGVDEDECGGISDEGETNAFDDRDDDDEAENMGEEEDDSEEDVDEDSTGGIEVVDYTNTQHKHEKLSKAELRAFMVCVNPFIRGRIISDVPL